MNSTNPTKTRKGDQFLFLTSNSSLKLISDEEEEDFHLSGRSLIILSMDTLYSTPNIAVS